MQKCLGGYKFFATDHSTLDLNRLTADWLRSRGITHIVNCAAYTNVDGAEKEPDAAYHTNTLGVEKMAIAAAEARVRVLHISTDYVYDGKAEDPYTETDSTNPVQVYGRSKLQGELILQQTCPDSIIIRTQWLYSPHGHNFVKTMLRMAGEGSPLSVVDDQWGCPTSARSLAQAIMQVLQREWLPGIYNYSNQGETTWYRFAQEVLRVAGYDPDSIVPVTTAQFPAAAKRPAYTVLDKSKIINSYALVLPRWQDEVKSCVEQIQHQ